MVHIESWNKIVPLESAEVTAATQCQQLRLGQCFVPGYLREALTDQILPLFYSPTQINEAF